VRDRPIFTHVVGYFEVLFGLGEACTDEEVEQTLARVLTYASGEVLNDAEVQKFH
jgi:hypothetical protein